MMILKSDKTGQAEYDRFLDLMAKMYLKYGDKYRLVTTEDVLRQFPNRQCKNRNSSQKGAYPPSAVHWSIYLDGNIM